MTVTLTTKGASSKQYATGGYKDNAYLAFKGSYGVNTRVDFYFTGNNMPQVCLFADSITPDMTSGVGFLAINGFCNSSGASAESNWNERYVVFGPNKMSNKGATTELGGGGDRFIDCTQTTTSDASNSYKNINMVNLDANTNYKYSIFTYAHKDTGYLTFKIQVWTIAEDGTLTRIYCYEAAGSAAATKNQLASNFSAGNIICYAPVKGTGTATFSYVMPYACDNNGNAVVS